VVAVSNQQGVLGVDNHQVLHAYKSHELLGLKM